MARRKLVRMISVGLYGPHNAVVEKLEESGYNVSEEIRNCLLKLGQEKFPEEKAYSAAAKISAEIRKAKAEGELAQLNMTNEDYATKVLRGKIRSGGRVGFRIANGQELYAPLAKIKDYSVDEGFVAVHNQMLDRTFNYMGGKQPSEADYAKIFKGWDE